MTTTSATFVGPTTFQVIGMTCGHCRRAVREEIGQVPGVVRVDVDLPSGQVTVVADTPVNREQIAAAVDEAGYTLAS
jgi:copper ion binding protein